MGAGGLFQGGQQKAMFTNVEVNLLIPKDVSVINTQFNLQDYIDDNFEEMERMQYFVSTIKVYQD